ncbi:MAG: hypothetical protein A2499_13265 [Stygiobacter sp. RIFOXYC12_FULL_38_8]|nr:MAG: hypothetical protein A2279_04605 [Stygiobacter sp. RIFOXYA12_FULL_38_9]OGV06308.1 MAG: hypothetical protein A2299_12845 [Stygiobacter sp. RIFOXYB2_FULL_37_11]OGV11082.1 MAG: hypothetical protein A2237_04600 [Stygiobacter sp. RIFOXYA2_FULL_38_8]OGV16058.1 MAG: hypothetical protein A2440_03770 [Stygiobacter sp. RIFOXYC2_FULL_38_25]OGV26256.1 MAG: hypothetical protein A2499_13265 [Stygiobacter sp. RIFOXYC12_FULL_38_8]OGV80535.1 MAG: hypothetical protein A2X65_04930 [Stygiobacter sp. GWF2_
MTNKSEIEKLAKILSEVHGHCYRPFYELNGETSPEYIYSWETLPVKSKSKDEVDRTFFIEMAERVLEELNKNQM